MVRDLGFRNKQVQVKRLCEQRKKSINCVMNVYQLCVFVFRRIVGFLMTWLELLFSTEHFSHHRIIIFSSHRQRYLFASLAFCLIVTIITAFKVKNIFKTNAKVQLITFFDVTNLSTGE